MGFFKDIIKGTKENIKKTVERTKKAVLAGGKTYAETGDIWRAVASGCTAYQEEKDEQRKRDTEKLKEKKQKNQQQVKKQAEDNAENFAENIGDEAIVVEDASANELRRITNELNDMQEKFIEKAERIESDIISYVKTAIHETISEFEEINTQEFGGAALDLNISYLKTFESDIKVQIKGRIKNAVRRNLSIDNEKCRAVLNKPGKKAKKDAMNNLQIKIYKNAIEELWAVINDTISSQNQTVFMQIENRLNAIEINVNESLRQLEEIERTKNVGEEELRKKQAELQSMIDISSWCMAQLSKENLA